MSVGLVLETNCFRCGGSWRSSGQYAQIGSWSRGDPGYRGGVVSLRFVRRAS